MKEQDRRPGGRVGRLANLGCAAGAALLAMVGPCERVAAASIDHRGVVAGTGACPETEVVLNALAALVAIDRIEERLRDATGKPPVEVTDLGGAFRVRAGGRTREYEDEVRDCGNRAKLAALFVALAADSADERATDAPTATPAASTAPTAAPARQPPSEGMPSRPLPPRPVLSLEVAADGRLAVGASSTAPGGLLRLAWGRDRVAVVGGVRGSAPAQATIGDVRVRQWRVAAQVVTRVLVLQDGPVLPFFEVGAVAALVAEKGSDFAASREGLAGELGLVGGAGASFLRGRWGSAFMLVEAELDPVPPHVSSLPGGDGGSTPRVWVGAAAGLSVGLF